MEVTELRDENEKLGWQIKVEKREDREKMKRWILYGRTMEKSKSVLALVHALKSYGLQQ